MPNPLTLLQSCMKLFLFLDKYALMTLQRCLFLAVTTNASGLHSRPTNAPFYLTDFAVNPYNTPYRLSGRYRESSLIKLPPYQDNTSFRFIVGKSGACHRAAVGAM